MKYELLKDKIIIAMKSKDINLSFYRYLDSIIQKEAFDNRVEITDDLLVSILKKEYKKIFENASKTKDIEMKIISEFLPTMLSEDESRQIITKIIEEGSYIKKDIGLVMKKIKTEYTNIDMGFASKIVKELLK